MNDLELSILLLASEQVHSTLINGCIYLLKNKGYFKEYNFTLQYFEITCKKLQRSIELIEADGLIEGLSYLNLTTLGASKLNNIVVEKEKYEDIMSIIEISKGYTSIEEMKMLFYFLYNLDWKNLKDSEQQLRKQCSKYFSETYSDELFDRCANTVRKEFLC